MKKPLVDKHTRYRIELLIILLVVTVLLNILVYWLNRKHDESIMRTSPAAQPSQ